MMGKDGENKELKLGRLVNEGSYLQPYQHALDTEVVRA